jgi:hypothetical protein
MALPYPIASTQTDAKSPVDDNLMDSIRLDLDYLDTSIVGVQSFDYQFKMNGPLSALTPAFGIYKRLDGAMVVKQQTLQFVRLYAEIPGTTGTLEIDLRKYRKTNTAITGIQKQYSASINSIAQVAPGLATQSISRVTPQIATQSISLFRPAINIASITPIGSNLSRINLSASLDSNWANGNSITVAGATAGANNGAFTIVRINDDGLNNIVVTNASAVEQTSASGTVQLNAWSYNYSNPVSTEFVAGESVVMAGHSNAGNNGTFTIFAINQAGNNIIVKNASGVAQAGVAGTADVTRWVFSYASAVGSDFVVGERARMSGHTSGLNNGDFLITAVNQGGNNLVVSNPAGVAQGGIAGNANTTRWVYALPTDPSTQFVVGQSCVISGTTSGANSGTFEVKQINRLATNNIVVSNTSGVAQVGASGTLAHERTIISFASDQSAIYSTASNVEVTGTVSTANQGYFDVVEVNRGGGANYNVVVINRASVAQNNPVGRVAIESKSIFATRPTLVYPHDSYSNTYNNEQIRFVTASGGALNAEATITATDVANGILLGFDIVRIPTGAIADIVVQIA